MGHWEFNVADPSDVRVEVTQRDQFNNDEVGLGEALVREVIQNSSDARSGEGPVKVRFAIRESSGTEAEYFSDLLAPLETHMIATKTECSCLLADTCRVLVIEDFNTKGLTGNFNAIDGENFDNFWRAIGKSEKKGQSGGRWGLGKLVYSSSSQVKVFFGLTLRAGDAGPALMGQAVLSSHVLEGNYHPPHGFWFESRCERFQQPVTDAEEISRFAAMTGISRTTQTGLSIVIPYLLPGITEKTLIEGVISNYYFPILAGRLEVEVGDELINRHTFDEVVSRFDIAASSSIPFSFVRQISDSVAGTPTIEAIVAIGRKHLNDDILSAEEISALKESYARGNLVHLRLPVRLEERSGVVRNSHVDLFLKSIPETEKPFSLFARGPIILPGERKYFGGAMAMGALVANDDGVAALLGDAENPAHTAWNAHAEKLSARWQNGASVLSTIRHALKQLYVLIAEQQEHEQKDALIDFFSIADQAQASSGKRTKSPKPKPDVQPREKAISIRGRKGGFEIVAGPGAAAWNFPRNIRVRMAYDIIGADPFKRHSKFDFDLENGSEIEFDTVSSDVAALEPNIMEITVTSPDFRIEATGFDERRDLVVDARAI